MVSTFPASRYVSFHIAALSSARIQPSHHVYTTCRNDLISVMLSAPFHTTKAVLPSMIDKGAQSRGMKMLVFLRLRCLGSDSSQHVHDQADYIDDINPCPTSIIARQARHQSVPDLQDGVELSTSRPFTARWHPRSKPHTVLRSMAWRA